jgi:hypothetical protein
MGADDQPGAHRGHDRLRPFAIQGNMVTQGERRDPNPEQEQTTDSSMPMAIAGDEIRQAERQRSAEKERFKFLRSSDQSGESGDGKKQRSRDTMHKAGRGENDGSPIV